MITRNLIYLFTGLGILYVFTLLSSGCAQIGVPTGGPRDSLPPTLLNSNPPNRTTNFKGKSITLTFDEYVQLQNLQENLLVAPTPKRNPDINFKLKTVTIKLRDTLIPNTTYSVQLGKSIQDINENNPYPDFTYVFSTGSYIDSLTFSGSVQLAETGKVDTTLLVFLYDDLDDSAVYKTKPKYISRLKKEGQFLFENLAQGKYHVFALKDESGQRVYNDSLQLFAFADSAVDISKEAQTVKLFAYAEKGEEEKSGAITPVANKKNNEDKGLTYSTSLKNGTQDLLTPLKLQFQIPLMDFDSTKIKLTDTLFNPIANATATIDSTHKIITINPVWVEYTDYKLIIDTSFAKDTVGTAIITNDTIAFKTKKERDYGSIRLNFKNLEKFKNPVLQFVANNEVVGSYPLSTPTFYLRLIEPGEYELRILEDTNNNGIWDPGDYDIKKQPEIVTSIPLKLSIKDNWENERDIEL